MKNFFAFVIARQILSAIFSLALFGAVIYIAWHFVSKLW